MNNKILTLYFILLFFLDFLKLIIYNMNMKNLNKSIVIVIVLLNVFLLAACQSQSGILPSRLSMPSFYSSNMILQRDKPLVFKGKDIPGSLIQLDFAGKSAQLTASKQGDWKISLPAMSKGGPYTLTVKGSSHFEYQNIYLGDLWFCSGQSNMEWTMQKIGISEEEIQQSEQPRLHFYTSTEIFSNEVLDNVPSPWKGWQNCTAQRAANLSATAYYFAQNILKETDCHIGLIISAWGGTEIEAWMDPQSAKEFPNLKKQLKTMDKNFLFGSDLARAYQLDGDFLPFAMKYLDPGLRSQEEFFKSSSSWKEIDIASPWSKTWIGNKLGVVWYNCEFEVDPAFLEKGPFTLYLGNATLLQPHFYPEAWLNNQKLENSELEFPSYSDIVYYELEKEALKPGKNRLFIRLPWGYEIFRVKSAGYLEAIEDFALVNSEDEEIILEGPWQAKMSIDLSTQGKLQQSPSVLYNAMVHPFTDLPVKGIIWYQGEANQHNPFVYADYFKSMIKGWRNRWQEDLPFCYVQLASYGKVDEKRIPESWAYLRESQTKALNLDKTAMAVTIDIGEKDNIHPKNKQEAGRRLALAALKTVYGKDITASGPRFIKMEKEGSKVRVYFDQSELKAAKSDADSLSAFQLAGENQQFVGAQARIDGSTVLVWSNDLENPQAVRYAWANYPKQENLLYNQEGLPAIPFRSDDWKPEIKPENKE